MPGIDGDEDQRPGKRDILQKQRSLDPVGKIEVNAERGGDAKQGQRAGGVTQLPAEQQCDPCGEFEQT